MMIRSVTYKFLVLITLLLGSCDGGYTIHKIEVRDVPKVVEQLRSAENYPAYAVFTFVTPDRPTEDDVLNLQFNLKDGKIGCEWVLLGPRNIEDQKLFEEYARSNGYFPVREEQNGVKYIRVEDGDVGALCLGVLTEVYDVPSWAVIGLVVEGFVWEPGVK